MRLRVVDVFAVVLRVVDLARLEVDLRVVLAGFAVLAVDFLRTVVLGVDLVALAEDLEEVLRPKRPVRPDLDFSSSIFWACSRVMDFGSVSLGILTLLKRPGPLT